MKIGALGFIFRYQKSTLQCPRKSVSQRVCTLLVSTYSYKFVSLTYSLIYTSCFSLLYIVLQKIKNGEKTEFGIMHSMLLKFLKRALVEMDSSQKMCQKCSMIYRKCSHGVFKKQILGISNTIGTIWNTFYHDRTHIITTLKHFLRGQAWVKA